jgi:hypothetical protein
MTMQSENIRVNATESAHPLIQRSKRAAGVLGAAAAFGGLASMIAIPMGASGYKAHSTHGRPTAAGSDIHQPSSKLPESSLIISAPNLQFFLQPSAVAACEALVNPQPKPQAPQAKSNIEAASISLPVQDPSNGPTMQQAALSNQEKLNLAELGTSYHQVSLANNHGEKMKEARAYEELACLGAMVIGGYLSMEPKAGSA